jgi:hypothetical protein
MAVLTLMVLIDALRPDYVGQTRFLRDLARQSATGQLRECFGFVPRAAYFGGLSAEQFGFTNMFCYDPAQSPFKAAPGLAGRPDARDTLNGLARQALPAFAAQYVSSFEIPLEHAGLFAVVEQRAPWDPKVGYRSLFHRLDAEGIPWLQMSWPDTNRLPDHSDPGIVRATLAALRPEHRFAYVHLQQLDATGHLHGPGSAALQHTLEETDQAMAQLISEARRRYDAVNLLVFGDHGMVAVTGALDVWTSLRQTGLVFGRDLVYFIDSTMVRLWPLRKQARPAIERALSALPGGRLLSAADLRHYGIAGCDRRNGELYFLADPGVLLVPNFFQSNAEFTRGMHGYDPDCPDNLGAFILHRPDQPGLVGQTLGKVDPAQIYPLVCGLMGLIPQVTADGRRKTEDGSRQSSVFRLPSAVPTTARYTQHPDPRADQAVAETVQTVVEAVLETIGEPRAIVLTGGFGRGEGAVIRDTTGRLRAYNDLDLIVVDDVDRRQAVRALAQQLPGRLGLAFVDLSWSDGRWEQLPACMATIDLKFGSQVVFGDTRVLDRVPTYVSRDLPASDLIRLLLNRAWGVLSGPWREDHTPEPTAYQRYQLAKAFVALGDAYLWRWGGYDSSYRVRAERFKWLAPGAGVAPELAAQVAWGFQAKLDPDRGTEIDLVIAGRHLCAALEPIVVQTLAALTGQISDDIVAAMTAYVDHLPEAATWMADNYELERHPALAPYVRQTVRPASPIRTTLMAAGPLLLLAAFDPARQVALTREAAWHLLEHFDVPSSDDWHALRDQGVRLWLDGLVH